MKPAVPAKQRVPPQTKKRTHAYCTLIYRAHKEINPAAKLRSPEFFTTKHGFPRPILLRLVGLEASRLSKANRLKVITLQEISAATRHVQRRIHARTAA